MSFTERQRKRIVENLKKEQGEIMAEFDYEFLRKEIADLRLMIEGLVDIVKADTQAMIRYETRLQSLESELRSLRKRANGDESQSNG